MPGLIRLDFAGVPIVMLNVVGGVDTRAIVLMYAAVASMACSLAAASVWVSTGAKAGRGGQWGRGPDPGVVVVPLVLATVPPRFGIHLPGWAATANAWLMDSSPLYLAMRLAAVCRGRAFGAVAWMAFLQCSAALLFLIWASAIADGLSRQYRRRSAVCRADLQSPGLAASNRPMWVTIPSSAARYTRGLAASTGPGRGDPPGDLLSDRRAQASTLHCPCAGRGLEVSLSLGPSGAERPR